MPDTPDDPASQGTGFTRRGFIATIGTGAVAAATVAQSASAEAAPVAAPDPAEMVRVSLTINGRSHRLLVEPRWSLLFVLRERLGLTATKLGCERGECGVCSGEATCTADVLLPGMLYGAILRSPHTHAKVKTIDTSKAEKVPGVAAVAAETPCPAWDAVRAIAVEYEVLPFVAAMEDALKPGAVPIYQAGNRSGDVSVYSRGDVAAAAETAVKGATPLEKNGYKVPMLKGIITESLLALA